MQRADADRDPVPGVDRRDESDAQAWISTFEWNCSRLVRKVRSTAIPTAPPRLRIMLRRAEAEPACSLSMPTVAAAVSGGCGVRGGDRGTESDPPDRRSRRPAALMAAKRREIRHAG